MMGALCLAVLLCGAAPGAPAPTETPVKEIALQGAAASRAMQFSGMAWHGPRLILLPQYPHGQLWFAGEEAITEALTQPEPTLALQPLLLESTGLEERIPGFQGYEALAVWGGECALAIETEQNGAMGAWVVWGSITASALRLDPESLTPVPLHMVLHNMAVEALVHGPEGLLAIQEAPAMIEHPTNRAAAVTMDKAVPTPFPAVPYRLTDATALDNEGRFWVSNYLWPGDLPRLEAPRGALFGERPPSGTHQRLPMVERLIELQWKQGAVQATPAQPLYLELDSAAGRNWEGLVRWPAGGFLAVTDAHPRTIFCHIAPPLAPTP